MSAPVVIAAGGTGGHMIPAHVLALELAARGREVVLLSDERGLKLPGLFEGVPRHLVPSGTPGRGGVAAWPAAFLRLLQGRAVAARLLKRLQPAAVIGFGGYPALPGLLAATAARIPTLIHEQNAVLGRVNRLLAPRVDRIATSYAQVERLSPRLAPKVRLVGNPVREEIGAIGAPPSPEPLNLLVLGGSQGASILSAVVPTAVALLGRAVRVTQQARAADLEAARATYATAGVEADLAPFFTDIPARLAAAHLLVARAGASTIAELTASGRPAILVPLPTAMDDHQTANARELARAGGAVLIPQAEFTPQRLRAELEALTPERLAAMARAARAMGRPNAARALADLVEEVARVPAPATRTPPIRTIRGVAMVAV